ncbi:MAG: DUF1440 domain-containing protein [Acidobacteria bacterium]|nr:DUF1440 domain-containing protein [Acidobacteriota bacterium]
MSATPATLSTDGPKAYQTILRAGLLAGALDITAACVSSWLRAGVGPVRVLQSVASGLLGADSYQGGLKSAALGLPLHFLIALGAAAVYYAASRRLEFLARRPVVSGLLYGVAVQLFMTFFVLRVSAFPHKFTFRPASFAISTGILMLFIGLPVALVVSRDARRESSPRRSARISPDPLATSFGHDAGAN